MVRPGVDEFTFFIDLPVRNEWKNIDLLRTSVQNCFAAVFSEPDGCHALSMVTGELLENAMKYGAWNDNDPPGSFRLRVTGKAGATRVSVENPIVPGDPGVDAVKNTIAWIDEQGSAEAAYRARLIEIASADDSMDGSKLGLVRIAYEGDCTLDAVVEGDKLVVTAELKLEP